MMRENVPGKRNGIAKVEEKISRQVWKQKQCSLDGMRFVFGMLKEESGEHRDGHGGLCTTLARKLGALACL